MCVSELVWSRHPDPSETHLQRMCGRLQECVLQCGRRGALPCEYEAGCCRYDQRLLVQAAHIVTCDAVLCSNGGLCLHHTEAPIVVSNAKVGDVTGEAVLALGAVVCQQAMRDSVSVQVVVVVAGGSEGEVRETVSSTYVLEDWPQMVNPSFVPA